MKVWNNIIALLLLLSVAGMYSCASAVRTVRDPNIGQIEIDVRVLTGKDSLARTPDGNVIGRIDSLGNIFDRAGNKIGQRKPTDTELIEQAGF